MSPAQDRTLLVDGECGVCSLSAGFTRRRDTRNRIAVEALQSETGQKILKSHGLPSSGLRSVVWIESGRVYTRSTAVLRYFRALDGAWPLLYAFIAVPRPVRDFFYDLFAKNRYRFGGSR